MVFSFATFGRRRTTFHQHYWHNIPQAQYLPIIEKMQRGGPFALLLMVFHCGDGDDGSSAAACATKEAQDKMRTMMGGHDVAPRIEGLNGIKIDAWIENIRTLTKHGLIKRTKRMVRRLSFAAWVARILLS